MKKLHQNGVKFYGSIYAWEKENVKDGGALVYVCIWCKWDGVSIVYLFYLFIDRFYSLFRSCRYLRIEIEEEKLYYPLIFPQ